MMLETFLRMKTNLRMRRRMGRIGCLMMKNDDPMIPSIPFVLLLIAARFSILLHHIFVGILFSWNLIKFSQQLKNQFVNTQSTRCTSFVKHEGLEKFGDICGRNGILLNSGPYGLVQLPFTFLDFGPQWELRTSGANSSITSFTTLFALDLTNLSGFLPLKYFQPGPPELKYSNKIIEQDVLEPLQHTNCILKKPGGDTKRPQLAVVFMPQTLNDGNAIVVAKSLMPMGSANILFSQFRNLRFSFSSKLLAVALFPSTTIPHCVQRTMTPMVF